MYRAAVIGLGNIGLQYDIPRKATVQSHSLAYQMHKAINFVAAVGVRPEQGKQLALLAPETAFYTDVPSMLKEQNPDILSICTPSHIRLDLLQTVFQTGTPRIIFLEKPVATSLAEAENIAALVKRHNSKVIVNLSRRWSEGAALIRDAVQSERYGKVKTIHLRYTRGIYNYGSHLFDLVRFVAGSMDRVKVLRQVPTNMDANEDWTYSFLFTALGGAVNGFAEAFDDRDYLMFEMELYLEKGKIEMLKSGDEIRFYGVQPHPMLSGINQLVLERMEERLYSRSSAIANAVDHLVQILQTGVTPVSTLEDGMYPLYVAEALIRSYRNNGSVEEVNAASETR